MLSLLDQRRLSKAGVALLTGLLVTAGASAVSEDAEDSPLFTDSMQRTFAAMRARDASYSDNWQSKPARVGKTGVILVVEGSAYYSLAAADANTCAKSGNDSVNVGKAGPVPLSVTTEISCMPMPTCNSPTCSGSTCGATCGPPQPTICLPTCSGGATCQPNATCYMSTCLGDPSPTCAFPTCYGATCLGSITCQGQATCSATCTATNCATPLYDVKIPQPGLFCVSFTSSAQLRYALQFSTNLLSGTWQEAYSITGNSSAISLTHTNGAPRCYYRLLIQDL